MTQDAADSFEEESAQEITQEEPILSTTIDLNPQQWTSTQADTSRPITPIPDTQPDHDATLSTTITTQQEPRTSTVIFVDRIPDTQLTDDME